MGARPEDYARSAPFKSYIHVDDFESPKELAEYLHKLDEDDDLYNEYFKWKVKIYFLHLVGGAVAEGSWALLEKENINEKQKDPRFALRPG